MGLPREIVESAMDAYERGFSAIASYLNGQLAEHQIQCEVPLTRKNVGANDFIPSFRKLNQCMNQISAYSAELPDAKDWIYWTLGFVNGKENRAFGFGEWWHELRNIDFVVQSHAAKTPAWWEENILRPMNLHANSWRKWFRDLIENADQSPPDKLEMLAGNLQPHGREWIILQTMYEKGINSVDKRRSQSEITELAGYDDPNALKRVFRGLNSLGIVTLGSNGKGFYLTKTGIDLAKYLKFKAPADVPVAPP